MSGAGRYRLLWEHYYPEAGALIFAVDAADKLRLCAAWHGRPRGRARAGGWGAGAKRRPRRWCMNPAYGSAASTFPPPRAHRSVVARDELDTLLGHTALGPGVPLLLLANKRDLPGTLGPAEIAQARARARRGSARRGARLLAPACKRPARQACAEQHALARPRAHLHAHTRARRQALGLEGVRGRPWQVVPTNALTGEGLEEGVRWLAGKLLGR